MVALALMVLAPMQTLLPADELRQRLNAFEEKHFAGLVYVLRDGREVFFHSVGYADPETKRPFTKGGAIEIGSIVKPFVRIAFLRLAEKGKVNLRDSIGKCFDHVPNDKRPITLDILLHHRSGFKDIFGDDYQPMKRDDLMDMMLRSKLLFKPGEKEEYSNSGFSMLAAILEKITGEPIDDYLWRTQFKPLGMNRTGYRRSGWKAGDLPIGYDSKGVRWGTPLDRFWYPDGPSWNLRGNGGMMSTPAELGRWVHSIFESTFVSNAIRLKFSPGLFGKDAPPTRVWTGAGGNGIFNTVIAYSRSTKVTIVAFSTDGRFEIEESLFGMAPLIFKLAATAK